MHVDMDRALRIATIGAAFSANKGAASMLQAVVEALPEVLGACHFQVLTTYPEDDEKVAPVPGNATMEIVSCRPRELLFPMLPLAVLSRLVRHAGGSGRALHLTPALRALAGADVVLDLAGISFSDGRGVPILGYNTLMTGIPLLLSPRVIKCSQAMGPFRGRLNRTLARLVLSRLIAVTARGGETAKYLDELGLSNVTRAADLAYLLPVDESDHSTAEYLIGQALGEGPFVAIVPSAVVQRYVEGRGINYVAEMAEVIRRIVASGRKVLIIAHSARPGQSASHMNDLPLVREIYGAIDSPFCGCLDESLPPAVLRALLARADITITARFHGLVSALAGATPALVVGWSHKYREALAEFGLEEWCMDYDSLNASRLYDRYLDLERQAPLIRETIRGRLPGVVERAEKGLLAIAEAVADAERRE